MSLDFHDKKAKLILESHTFPCMPSGGFCKPTLGIPYTNVLFPKVPCLISHISVFIGQMSKSDYLPLLRNCQIFYWY